MVSVILPTREWTDACVDLAEQVGPDDELLVVCDHASDPVAERSTPANTDVLIAGDPEGCSGKCNAVATGLAAATDDIIVCTDDDFDHGPGWLDHVVAGVEEHGAVTSVPMFASEGLFGKFLEGPSHLLHLPVFLLGAELWGGTACFHRDEVDMPALVADLRRTVSDDVLMGEHIDAVHGDLSLAREITVEGSVRSSLHRSVRFTRNMLFTDPPALVAMFLVVALVAVGTALVPLLTGVITTAVVGAAYAVAGFDRWTFLLAWPGFLLLGACLAYGVVQPEFEWGGRRYRWTGQFSVDVLD
ncbi:glycosyltransferase family 2 protein [Haloarcula sp. JP-L23]|uniref:glycosyltransferase n=1 Tax=Haloarcula sp. JP-L23 TaxID=2716717 RepID=UPI00140EBE65|nr:glycosyltransferase family 2 protein [Haloarcula sp. JP-L23]